MNISRRNASKLIVLGGAAGLTQHVVGGDRLIASAAAQPQRGVAQQVMPVRMPLHEFVEDAGRLAALRRGVAEMKKRKPSDPLSWFFQAAIHGVTEQMIAVAKSQDDAVNRLDPKFWNQCPHFGAHSANFLPWHRGYTYHFEQILRLHTGDSGFALPYWDYSIPKNRTFPREFGIEHLDGNFENNDEANINPLYHAQRDFYLCGYEHALTDQLPLTDLSPRATDTSRLMKELEFFGADETKGIGGAVLDDDTRTRGVMEQAPHDQIHRAVGGVLLGTDEHGREVEVAGGMAYPPTAGFDPIFPVHHANIDRLWAVWAGLDGKSWGKNIPLKAWFDEKPWYFFDVNGQVVNWPRKQYFDYQALGVRFKYIDPSGEQLRLPPDILSDSTLVASSLPVSPQKVASLYERPVRIEAATDRLTAVPLFEGMNAVSRNEVLAADVSVEPVYLHLNDVDVTALRGVGFDVFLTLAGDDVAALSPQSPLYLGSLTLFVHEGNNHQGHGSHSGHGGVGRRESFDMSGALLALKGRSGGILVVVLRAYPLTTTPRVKSPRLKFESGPVIINGISITKLYR